MALWKDPKRGDWRWEFMYQRQRYTGAGHKKRMEALEVREKKRKELKQGAIPIGMAFIEASNLYLDYSQRRHAKKTYEYKKMVYQRFIEHREEDLEIVNITPFHLHDYLNTRPSNRNYNAHKAEICSFFSFCVNQLKILDPRDHPCLNLEDMPHTPAKKEIPSEEDLIKLILAAEPETEKPLILIILHTLARVDEILRLTWHDVNFEKREITLWTRKRSSGAYEPDTLFINDDLYLILKGLWEKRLQDYWVIYNKKTGTRYNRRPKMMHSICARAKIKTVGFHALRHFVATYLADQEKVSKKTVSGLLRHRSLGTTEIYLHTVPHTIKAALKKMEGIF